jgi:hypothetical protein
MDCNPVLDVKESAQQSAFSSKIITRNIALQELARALLADC